MWFYVSIWALQISGILFFHFAARRRMRHLRRVARDLFEAHELLLKAWNILRDVDSFDGRFATEQIHDHLLEKWGEMGLTEESFRKMAREVHLHAARHERERRAKQR